MLLTQSHVDLFGYCTVALASILAIFGLTCASYVLYLNWRIGKEHLGALRGFHTFWGVRISLVIYATVWAVLEIVRLPLVRRNERLLGSLSYKTQGLLCKCHLVFSSGFAIPCFFLTALFLVRDSIQRKLPFSVRRGRRSRGRSNRRLIVMTFFYALPCVLLQLLLSLFVLGEGSLDSGHRTMTGYSGTPAFLTQAYQREHQLLLNATTTTTTTTIGALSLSPVAVCTYPLLSTGVLMLFAGLYSVYFSGLCFQTLSLIINKTLRRRLLGLLAVFLVLLPLHVLFLGFSLIWRPGHILHELMLSLAFLNVLFCTSVGQGILVFRPIHDTLDAHVMNAAAAACESESQTGGGMMGFKGIHEILLIEEAEESQLQSQSQAQSQLSDSAMILVTDVGLSTDYHFSSEDEAMLDDKGKLDSPLVPATAPAPALAPPSSSSSSSSSSASKRHSYTLGVLPHPLPTGNRSPALPGRPLNR